MYINNNKDIYDYLYNYKDNIEKKMEFCFEWHRLDDKKASRILYKLDGLNFDDHSNYPALMEEIIDRILKMKEVFSKYLKEMWQLLFLRDQGADKILEYYSAPKGAFSCI